MLRSMNFASILSGIGVAAKALWTFAAFAVASTVAVLVIGYQAVSSVLSFLAQTWIIQTFVVAWVAFHLQEISLANTRKRDRLQAAYERKVEAAKALYSLIGRRIYASRRYLEVLEEEHDKISEERQKYRDTVTEWNEQAQLHQVTILLEFDSYFGLLVDHKYNPSFRKTDSLLRRNRLTIEAGNPSNKTLSREIVHELDDLNRVSLDVFREMLKEARKDRNIMDEKVAISEENIDQISYGRLFKALLQPGV